MGHSYWNQHDVSLHQLPRLATSNLTAAGSPRRCCSRFYDTSPSHKSRGAFKNVENVRILFMDFDLPRLLAAPCLNLEIVRGQQAFSFRKRPGNRFMINLDDMRLW